MPVPDLTQRLTVFVQKEGTDAAGANAVGAPQSRLTIAAALADLAANYPAASSTFFHIVAVGPGTYVEAGIVLPPWTWIVGSCDGEGQPTTVISLNAANVSLATAWNANSTQRGGFAQVTINAASGTPILDFTMPVPVAGNPTRTVELFNVHHNLTVEQFQATSTADAWRRELCRQAGTHTDTLTQTGGTSLFKSNWSAAAATIVDAVGFPASANWDGWIVTDALSGVTVSSVAAAGNTTKFTNSAVRALTLNVTAPGVLAFSADAVSLPIRSLVTYTGTATFATNVTLLSDAAGEAYTPTTPGNWSPVPATVQQALDELAASVVIGAPGTAAVANAAGDVTITPANHFWSAQVTGSGAAGTRNIILSHAGASLQAGDVIELLVTRPDGIGIIYNIRDGTAGGTILATIGTGLGVATGGGRFVYGTIATGYAAAAWYAQSFQIPATT